MEHLTMPVTEPADWGVEAVSELLGRLRRLGVRAYQGSVCPDGSMLFAFEREALGQKLTVETVLLAWPGVESVQHVAPGLVRACPQPPDSDRSRRSPAPRRWNHRFWGWSRHA